MTTQEELKQEYKHLKGKLTKEDQETFDYITNPYDYTKQKTSS